MYDGAHGALDGAALHMALCIEEQLLHLRARSSKAKEINRIYNLPSFSLMRKKKVYQGILVAFARI